MAANPQYQQSLTASEYLSAALVFVEKAQGELKPAPYRIQSELLLIHESLALYRDNLADELKEAVDEEGSDCIGCVYNRTDNGYTAGKGLTDEPLRECTARTPMTCPVVADILRGQ